MIDAHQIATDPARSFSERRAASELLPPKTRERVRGQIREDERRAGRKPVPTEPDGDEDVPYATACDTCGYCYCRCVAEPMEDAEGIVWEDHTYRPDSDCRECPYYEGRGCPSCRRGGNAVDCAEWSDSAD